MFKQRVIKITISLEDKEEYFEVVDDSKMNSFSHSGLRVSVTSNYGNGAMFPTATVNIFGLPMEKIDKLIRIRWNTPNTLKNKVRVEVGAVGESLKLFYQGDITFARLDTSTAPDVALVIESQVANTERQKLSPARSYKEGHKLQDIVAEICADMGFEFENNGVDIPVNSTTLINSDTEKIMSICNAYGVDYAFEHRLVAIMPEDTDRAIKTPVLTPSTGLLGYPTSTWQGIVFSCLYDPLVRFKGPVTIKDSVVIMANGDWRIFGVRTQLEANMPNGTWSMEVNATWKDGGRIVKSS